MDQIKIGKFISTKRKEKGITQSELAEMLNITDRAVSKWENGNCLPDAGTMPELCKTLNVSINDLFSGEVVDMKDNEKKYEDNLLEMTRLKEEKDRQLLALELVIGILAVVILLTLIFISVFIEMEDWTRGLLIGIGIVFFLFGMYFALKIEQIAGYYECANCHHKYVPTFSSVLWAMHCNRTRRMKCPKCGKKTWQKKVISK